MPDTNDMELLRDYSQSGSETAFAELVQRHLSLVYSTALRQVGNTAHAEEIAQAVFIVLARKAPALRPDTILEGWLYETTRLTALSFLRGERRRQFREQEAYMQSTLQEPGGEALWSQLAPLLEEAMGRLGRKDRDAVVLRFFKDRSVREVAMALQVSEAAAQRRILRAVEKLRGFFGKRCVDSPADVIAQAISVHSIQSAPPLLAKTVTAAALAKGAIASSSTLTLVKGVLKVMAWTKAKMAIVAAAGVILATSVSVVIIEKESLIDGKTEDQWIRSIRYMGDDNQTKRWRALGPRGVRMLVRGLRSPAYDHSTRMCIADLLANLRNDAKSAIPEIIKQIKIEKDPGVLQIEIGYFEGPLQRMSEKDKAALLPELLRTIQSTDAGIRNNSLVALQFYPERKETVVPLMVNALQDPDPQVRLMAVEVLYKIDPQAVVKPEIIRVVVGCSTNSATANDATILLGTLHCEPDLAVPALIQNLENPNAYIRADAASSLGRFGGQAKAAMPALTKSLEDSDLSVRRQASGALHRINSNTPPR